MKRYFLLFLFILIPITILSYYYQFYNPDNPFSIQCGLYRLTGFQCPGCGGQRALHSLLHGDIVQAFRYNVLFVIGLPFLIYLYYELAKGMITKGNNSQEGFIYSSACGYIFLLVLFVFFILRNISAFSFL